MIRELASLSLCTYNISPVLLLHTLIFWNISALLYVKLHALEHGIRSIKACKTRRFSPSISVHFRPEKDNSTLSIELPTNRDDLTCQFSLCTKPTLGECLELPSGVHFSAVVMEFRANNFDISKSVLPTLHFTEFYSQRKLLKPIVFEGG
jgi:hypothetical protein